MDPSQATHPRRTKLFQCILLLTVAILWISPASAFPPAPYFTIFGYVRDQYGILIPPGAASLVVLKDSREILRQPLTAVGTADHNYQIRMRMEMLRPATTSYSSKALSTGTVYTIAVDVGGQLLLPIEMNTPPSVGGSAERRRLNLTLGIDSDGDGLPDAWEESQLHHAGISPGADGWDLSLTDRDGDFDKDGVSNYGEYLAGTYATDASSILALQVKEKLGNFARLEFYGFYGKSYVLETSTDLQTWSVVSFSLEAPVEETLTRSAPSLLSNMTGVTNIYTGAPVSSSFYRITSR